MLDLKILYRGPLSSCNYDCRYCPFAKRRDNAAQLAADRAALERFVDWVAGRCGDRISVLFTPWGEALIRRWYQEALVRLSHLPQTPRVAIQTNLACDLNWVPRCDPGALALWITFHPTQITRERFLEKLRRLDDRQVRYSVGMVGLKENLGEAQRLRAELAEHVYLWINAYKDQPNYYTAEDLRAYETIDPLFLDNTRRYRSLGRDCRAGETVISVDGAGEIRRCHFIAEPLHNIYEPGFEQALRPRRCTNNVCGCHIGYVHLKQPDFYAKYGEGILERIPATEPRPATEPIPATGRRSADGAVEPASA